jgi:uroporphyrinogen decarboxylase
MTTTMTPQERVGRALKHQETDRIPITDSPWGATVDRWRQEGLPQHIEPAEFFGFEMTQIGADFSPMFPVRVVGRNEEYITETTSYGGIRRNHRDHSTTPEIIDYALKSREDWAAVKKRLQPSFTRVNWVSERARYDKARHEGKFITFSALVGYDLCQLYIRTEELLMYLLTDTDWIRDIVETHADLVIAMAQMMIEQGFAFDGAFLYEDMGYRKAPLFSPRTYRAVYQPADQRLWDFFHAHNMPVILHSCGNVKPLIPDLIATGLDCLQPLEVKAGMDLVELKREYGDDLAFMGGIDVRTMNADDPGAIEREIRTKIPVAMKGGGYIYHSDHSIPNNVSFAQYQRVLELVRLYGAY